MLHDNAYEVTTTGAAMARLDLDRDSSQKLPKVPSTSKNPMVSIKNVGVAAAAVKGSVGRPGIGKERGAAAAALKEDSRAAAFSRVKQGQAGAEYIKKVNSAATAAATAIEPVFWEDVEFSCTSNSEDEWSTHADGSSFSTSIADSDDIYRSTPDYYAGINDKRLGYYVAQKGDESAESEKPTKFKFNEDEITVIRENFEQIRMNLKSWAMLFHAFYITRGYDEVRVEMEKVLERFEVEAMEKDAAVLSWKDLFAKKSGHVREEMNNTNRGRKAN